MALRETRVLLVEDNPEHVFVTKRILKLNKLDRDLILADSGRDAQQALESCAEKGALPGLILLDLNLPDISGIELLTRIKKDPRFSPIPVVILTGSNVDDDIQRSYDLGASTYLVKPISSQALMSALGNLL
ncbi:MAG: response regulator [Methanotrichaceae archaeon]|nr:response regulator [Methanotrichaceae archaeon]